MILKYIFQPLLAVFSFFRPILILGCSVAGVFVFICLGWFVYFRFICKMKISPSGQVVVKKTGFLRKILVDLPRRYVLDFFNRTPGYFYPKGIHMFCGEQGCGKTMACVELMLRLQKRYPLARMITNFAVATENDSLDEWQQLLTYKNGHFGVIVGIDEIQNWFMSGLNKLPEGMLEVATQNRKNNRILCCTAQVFTRVNKGLREQVSLVYEPHTLFGCWTIVLVRKPIFDPEGNVIHRKIRKIYSFVHTEELRNAYDTYKVIHTLAKEGFKEKPISVEQKITVVAGRR